MAGNFNSNFFSSFLLILLSSFLLILLLLSTQLPTLGSLMILTKHDDDKDEVFELPQNDVDLLDFPLNLEYLEAEFFLSGALGHGLDKAAPDLTQGGPPPIGTKKAKLIPFLRDIVTQYAYQEIGRLRAIKKSVKGFPRPLLDLSTSNFAKTMDSALKRKLNPPFDPYANSLNYLLSSYLIPYVGLTGYVGSNPKLQTPHSKRLVAGLLAVESAQDAVIRTLLYNCAKKIVEPYNVTVAEITDRISEMRDKLGGDGVKDEGIIVPLTMGAEANIQGNIIAGDKYSLAYDRSPQEILRIVYGNGTPRTPGGFFPNGTEPMVILLPPIVKKILRLIILLFFLFCIGFFFVFLFRWL